MHHCCWPQPYPATVGWKLARPGGHGQANVCNTVVADLAQHTALPEEFGVQCLFA